MSFWEAVDKISRSSGLMLQQGYGDDHVRLYPQDAYSPHVHYEGAFRFSATGFSQYRNIDFSLAGPARPAPQARTDSLTLMFSVFVEPKMAILGVGEPHLDAAYDNEKNSLLVPVNPNELTSTTRSADAAGRRASTATATACTAMQTQVNMRRPSEQATTAKVIRGTLPVTLLVEQKEAVVTDKVLEAKGAKVRSARRNSSSRT